MTDQKLMPFGNELLNQEAFDDFVSYRKKILRKPVKDLVRLEGKFCRWPHSVQRAAVDDSMDNDYQGVFFDKFAKQEIRGAQKKTEGFIARHTDKTWAEGL